MLGLKIILSWASCTTYDCAVHSASNRPFPHLNSKTQNYSLDLFWSTYIRLRQQKLCIWEFESTCPLHLKKSMLPSHWERHYIYLLRPDTFLWLLWEKSYRNPRAWHHSMPSVTFSTQSFVFFLCSWSSSPQDFLAFLPKTVKIRAILILMDSFSKTRKSKKFYLFNVEIH